MIWDSWFISFSKLSWSVYVGCYFCSCIFLSCASNIFTYFIIMPRDLCKQKCICPLKKKKKKIRGENGFFRLDRDSANVLTLSICSREAVAALGFPSSLNEQWERQLHWERHWHRDKEPAFEFQFHPFLGVWLEEVA